MRTRHTTIHRGLIITAVMAVVLLSAGWLATSGSKRPSASELPRQESHAIAPADDTPLSPILTPAAKAHSGESGFALVGKGEDALRLRISMIEGAKHSLDMQYYMFDDDRTGKLVLEALLRAADRGVSVRILVDDFNLHGSDFTWPVLAGLPNIEMRVFNPFATREEPLFTRAASAFTGVSHFLRRMHNKMLIADNQLAIAGGRNLGDAYFDAGSDFNFHDVDVLAVGPIVPDMSKSFDRYWNGEESFPLGSLLKTDHRIGAPELLRGPLQQRWETALKDGTLLADDSIPARLRSNSLTLLWGKAELAADAPAKLETPPDVTVSKPEFWLGKLAGQAQHELLIVSPYFVPGDDGVAWLKSLVDRGVSVQALTNSLASTDAIGAHAGYRRYREPLLKDGIQLYEMRPIPGSHPHSHRFSSSDRASLHSKIYVIDGKDVIVGSFNFDPRSKSLNTEDMLVIHNSELAAQVAAMFAKATSPASSFHVVLDDGKLKWVTTEDGQEKTYSSEPETGFIAGMWRQIKVDLLGMLPFENQL